MIGVEKPIHVFQSKNEEGTKVYSLRTSLLGRILSTFEFSFFPIFPNMLFTLACVVGDLILQFTMRHHKRIVLSGRSLCLLWRRDALCWGEIGIFMAFVSSKFFLPYSSSFLLGAVEGPSFWWGGPQITSLRPPILFAHFYFLEAAPFFLVFFFPLFHYWGRPSQIFTPVLLHRNSMAAALAAAAAGKTGLSTHYQSWSSSRFSKKNLSSPLFSPRQTRSTIGGGGVGAVWRQTSRCGNRCFPSLLSKAFCWTFHWFYSFYLVSFE